MLRVLSRGAHAHELLETLGRMGGRQDDWSGSLILGRFPWWSRNPQRMPAQKLKHLGRTARYPSRRKRLSMCSQHLIG